LCLRPDAFWLYRGESFEHLSGEVHRLHVRESDILLRRFNSDTNDEPISVWSACHAAPHHERDPAEHLLFDDIASTGQHASNASQKFFAVSHDTLTQPRHSPSVVNQCQERDLSVRSQGAMRIEQSAPRLQACKVAPVQQPLATNSADRQPITSGPSFPSR